MLIGVLGRREMVDEGRSGLLVALDVLGPQPSGELARVYFDPLDPDASRDDARDLCLGLFAPLVEGSLQAAPVLSERSDCIVVLPAVPSDDDQIGLGLGHSRHRSSSESNA